MAVRYGLLPPETPVAPAVMWAWGRFMRSSDARALAPEDQVVANLQSWVAQRWGVTIREVGTPGGSQKAEGWFDEDAVYILREGLRGAAGNILTEEATASILRGKEFLQRTEKDVRPYIRYIKGLGKIQAYALKRSEFGREAGASDNVVAYPAGGRYAV